MFMKLKATLSYLNGMSTEGLWSLSCKDLSAYFTPCLDNECTVNIPALQHLSSFENCYYSSMVFVLEYQS